ncbi:MAG: hypothetical protein AMXMBFR4_20080 [Candidatus Hydrogenedentota bacterium]
MLSHTLFTRNLWCAAAFMLVAPTCLAASDGPASEAGRPVSASNFRLEDHAGASHELYRLSDAKAVVLFFHGNGCPIVRKSVAELRAIRDEYAPQGVTFWFINGNADDRRAEVVKEAAEFGIDFPILMDSAQLVTRDLGTTRTAEAVVLNPRGWRIEYRGAVDDRLDYGVEKPQATSRWLRDALDAVLAGDRPQITQTETRGCRIDLLREPKRTSYAKHIAPLLQKKCASCHVEGHIGPFAMDSYEKVAGRKRMIREVLMTKRMPPWHADPHSGEFANDSSLDREELRSLIAWIDAGAPRGDGEDPLLQLAGADASEYWPMGQPDLVFEMPRSFTVPASGVVDYQYFRVRYTGAEDIWVRGADILPGNRAVLHHALIFINYPDRLKSLEPDFEGGLDGFFAGYVPGMLNDFYPKDTGKFVPAGSEFVFQMHYTTNGRSETDRSKLGLYVAKKKPKREFFTRAAANTDFEIPPNSPDSETESTYDFTHDVLLYEMGPHMHYRGKRFQYHVKYPDGRSELLLSVPNYDFNWQTMYRLKEPKRIPAGSQLYCVGAFDNSASNPHNPDPNRWIYFGEQSFEEMFIGYMGYAYVDPNAADTAIAAAGIVTNMGAPITAENLPGTVWRIGRFKLSFFENGEMRVGKTWKGTWKIEGDRLLIHVANEDHVIFIRADQLHSEDGPLEFLAAESRPAGGVTRVSLND